ncbi:hypothetical protein ACJX0J_039761, partial [Zea mays]
FISKFNNQYNKLAPPKIKTSVQIKEKCVCFKEFIWLIFQILKFGLMENLFYKNKVVTSEAARDFLPCFWVLALKSILFLSYFNIIKVLAKLFHHYKPCAYIL